MVDHRPTISGRIAASTLARLDRVAEELGKRRPGEVVRRSDALRVAVERGVEIMERELGIGAVEPSAPPTNSAPPAQKGAKRPARKPAK